MYSRVAIVCAHRVVIRRRGSLKLICPPSVDSVPCAALLKSLLFEFFFVDFIQTEPKFCFRVCYSLLKNTEKQQTKFFLLNHVLLEFFSKNFKNIFSSTKSDNKHSPVTPGTTLLGQVSRPVGTEGSFRESEGKEAEGGKLRAAELETR